MAGTSNVVTRHDVVTEDGAALAAWVTGPTNGPPVVLASGGGADHWGWRTLVPDLCASEDERRIWAPHGRSLAHRCRVAVFDQRGTGESAAVAPATSAQQLGADVVAVGRALLCEHFGIVGGSLGGMAALHAALDHPGTVTALVLLATTAGGTGLTWPTDEFLLFQESGNGDRLDHERARAGLALVLSETFRKCQEQLLDAFVEHARTQLVSDEIGAAQQNIFLTHDVATRLGEIAVPTVVICGTDDQAHPLPNSEFLTSGIPGARLVVVGGAGHLVHAEAPEQILDQALALFGA
jgi:3-oxoadipate enol-lactonase